MPHLDPDQIDRRAAELALRLDSQDARIDEVADDRIGAFVSSIIQRAAEREPDQACDG
jgi:hypothetical protein